MKKRDRIVIWLDYFNSALSRREGRRVPVNMATRNPSLQDLIEAARLAGYSVQDAVEARHPKRYWLKSGYIQIAKSRDKRKGQVIYDIAKALTRIKATRKG